jgi:hypothetical protein
MTQDLSLENYLAGGGKLSSPDNATPRYRGEVMRLIDTLGRGGGYILGSSHAIQAGTPPENSPPSCCVAAELMSRSWTPWTS